MASSVHINCHQGSAHQGAHAREGVYECVEGACMGVEGAGEGVESIRECVGSVHVGVEARRRGRGDVPAACAGYIHSSAVFGEAARNAGGARGA